MYISRTHLLKPSAKLFFFQAEDGIRDHCVTGVQTCALPILVEVIRYVRDGKADVLEHPGCTDETRHGEILFWCRQTAAKKAAHQRTGQNAEIAGERANGAHARRTREEHFKEPPAIVRRARQIDGELSQCLALRTLAAVGHESAAELTPPCRHSYVDQPVYSAAAERKHGVWCPRMQLRK